MGPSLGYIVRIARTLRLRTPALNYNGVEEKLIGRSRYCSRECRDKDWENDHCEICEEVDDDLEWPQLLTDDFAGL